MRLRALSCVLLTAAILVCSCSTTRVLREGQYRLASNEVEFDGRPEGLTAADVSSYVKQQANSYFIFGWSPSLCIYNWSNPDKDDWINNSLRKIGIAPVVFNGYQVASSRENIARHLDYLGYYNSTVKSHVDTTGRLVRVTYTVTPGERRRIDSIEYKIPEGEFSEEFNADLHNSLVKEGDWLSEKLLEAESVRSSSHLRNRGYYNFSKYNYFFEADTLSGTGKLIYEIRNYTRNEPEYSASPLLKSKIGNVTISYSADVPFREKVLTHLNVIQPGDYYSEETVNKSYNRLSNLRVFNNVGIEMVPVDSTTVDCRITMGESKLKGVKLSLEASTNSSGLMGISPNVSFYNKNIFHGGEWLSLGFSGDFQWKPRTDTRATEFGVSASLSFPRFVGLPYSVFKGSNIPRTEVQAAFNYQNRPEFERYILNTSFGYTGTHGNLYYQINPLRATVVKVNNMTAEFLISLLHNITLMETFYDHIDAGSGGQLYWTTDPSVVPKGAYRFARLDFDLSGNVLSLLNPVLPVNDYSNRTVFGVPYAQYVRANVDLGKTFKPFSGTALAMRLSLGAGYAYGNSSSMPYEKQFYVGGSGSMRGWQVRALGPGNTELYNIFAIPSQAGECKMEFDVELRQKLFWKFEGALFAEAGNVWDYYQFKEPGWMDSIAADWGLGIRLNLDFILLRVDWGMKLYEPSRAEGARWLSPAQWVGRNGYAVHFGVGYPF